MRQYAAPLSDILFTMKEVGGLDSICAWPVFGITTHDAAETILEKASRFADVPVSNEWEGHGLPILVRTALLEMWKASKMRFGPRHRLTLDDLVGEPSQGLARIATTVHHAQLDAGIESLGKSECAYQRARAAFCDRAKGLPSPLGHKVNTGDREVRLALIDLQSRVEAMRGMVYFCAGQMDRAAGHPEAPERARANVLVELLAPVVKVWCTDQALHVASGGVLIHRDMSYTEESGATRYLCDACFTSIFEATTDIQANSLTGRHLGRDGARAMKEFIARIEVDSRRILDTDDGRLAEVGLALFSAVDAVNDAVNRLLGDSTDRDDCNAAGVVPLLRLTGALVGGWLTARVAESAVAQLVAGHSEAGFLSAKVETAQHFAKHILVVEPALRDSVVSSADSTLSLADEQV